jgi:pyrroloquinoline-quinone synthase
MVRSPIYGGLKRLAERRTLSAPARRLSRWARFGGPAPFRIREKELCSSLIWALKCAEPWGYRMSDAFGGYVCTSAAIDAAVAERAMLTHPFYQAWEAGTLTRDALQAYAKQYFHHVEAFPRAVSAVHANCPDAKGRKLLAENLAEEEGLGEGKDDHASLWLGFAEGIGADEEGVRSVRLNPETQTLIDAFRRLSRNSYASGLGALYAYESQLPAIAKTKIKGLVDRYDARDPATLRFFEVHEVADLEHADVCRELLDALPTAERAEAHVAACELAEALRGFLTGMQRETGMC